MHHGTFDSQSAYLNREKSLTVKKGATHTLSPTSQRLRVVEPRPVQCTCHFHERLKFFQPREHVFDHIFERIHLTKLQTSLINRNGSPLIIGGNGFEPFLRRTPHDHGRINGWSNRDSCPGAPLSC